MSDTPLNPERPDRSPPTKEMLASFFAEFESACPTDAHCFVELSKAGSESNIRKCSYCGSDQVQNDPDGRIISCPDCKKSKSLTAGTFFHSIKRPRAWLAAIRLMEAGMVPSINQFHKLAAVAYDTAWKIYRKLGLVIADQLPADAADVHSSVFSQVICKRSRETPARQHPVAEVTAFDATSFGGEATTEGPLSGEPTGGSPELRTTAFEFATDLSSLLNDLSQAALATAAGDRIQTRVFVGKEEEVYDLLSKEPVHFDTLIGQTKMSVSTLAATLSILEIKEVARCLPGDWYVRIPEGHNGATSETPAGSSPDGSSKQATASVGDAIEYLSETLQGISGKYLQLCLAAFWCYIDRVRWPAGSVLNACHQSNPIRDVDILAYVSPALVKVPSG